MVTDMNLLSWLRRLGGAVETDAAPDHVLGHRERSPHEDELRAALAEDPNDREAFDDLAAIVRERADEGLQPDPLTAEAEPSTAPKHAVWALAEELAGQPKAWLPLVVLAELSLADDHETAMRRLSLACERETSGVALSHAIAMLRDAGATGDAVTFGVAHWELASRHVEAGSEIVQAALDANRVGEARRLLDSLAADPDLAGATKVKALERLVAAAEAAATRG